MTKVAIIVSAHLYEDDVTDEQLIEATKFALEHEFWSSSRPLGLTWKTSRTGATIALTTDAVQVVRLKEEETLMVVGKAVA